MNNILKEEGGISGFAEKYGWNKYYLRIHDELKVLLSSLKNKKIVLDVGGSATSSKFPASKFNAKLLSKRTKIVLILPNEEDEKGIQVLFNREKQRDHFKGWSKDKLMKKVRRDYFYNVPGMRKFAHFIIHTKKRKPKQLADYIMSLFKIN